MEDYSIFNYNKHKFYIDLEYLDSTLNIKKILPYCRLAVLCVLWISLGTECFPKFLAQVVFSRDKVFCLQVYYQCISLFCSSPCHSFIFSCTSVVCIVIPQKNHTPHTYTHARTRIGAHALLPLQQLLSKSTCASVLRQECMLLLCFIALLFSFKKPCFLLDIVGLKKKVRGLALSSCFSGEYKVPVDEVQTSGCLRRGGKKS